VRATGYALDKVVTPAFYQNYTTNMPNRFFTSLATLPVYARLVLWPLGMHIEWVFPVFDSLLRWLPFIGALMAGLAVVQVIRGRARRGLALSFGLLWFAAAWFPASGILFPLNTQFSENWLYMPLMGLALGVAETVAGFLKDRRQVAQGIVCGLALLLGTMTFLQCRIWLNTETFYNNVVERGGDPYRIVPLLGSYYLEQGEFDKALDFTRYQLSHPTRHTTAESTAQLHMQQALAWLHVCPDEDGNLSSLADIEKFVSKAPHIPEAINELGQAIAADPHSFTAHQYLTVIYRQQGNKPMAELHEKRLQELMRGEGP
jgi:tetratricopeptide (TPR) repeat protein